jgi:4-amino-4-deoxy-L-arabinose transferase-like glycosyltransferase
MNIPLLLLLAATIFLLARKLYGWRGGLVALIFLCVEPNVAAHAALVSPDFQVTVFLPLAGLALAWLLTARSFVMPVLVAGLTIALAVLAKFSGLALVPAFLIAPLALVRGGLRERSSAMLRVLCALLVGFAFVQAVYEGPRAVLGTQAIADIGGLDRDLDRLPFRVSELKRMLRSGNQGLGFVAGIRGTKSSVAEGYGNYLNGEVGESRWIYYPEAVLLKTPLPLLIAFAWGTVVLTRRKRWREPELGCLLLAAAFLVAGAMAGKLQIGVRHLLPLYPLFCVGAGACALSAPAAPGPWWRRWLLQLLVAWGVIEGVRYHPHHLAYFNQLAGGPAHAARYLAADNLDWGQDLRGLRKFQLEHRTRQLQLRYFGSVPPYRYDIDFVPLTSTPTAGWLAVSRTSLVSELMPVDPGSGPERRQRTYAWLDAFEPVALIGYSIAVYHLTEEDLRRAGLR